MIDKVKVGKRIIALRKECGYSQSDFADMLSVTPQAVSKWETGLALPDIEILLMMSGLFRMSINEILEGKNILYKIANRPFKMGDIAYFVPEEERDEKTKQWAKRIVDSNAVKNCWEYWKNNKGWNKQVAEKMINHGGIILEVCTRHTGGYMPIVLLEKPDASIIISGLSPTVLLEWKNLFETEFFPPNVCYAAVDNCDLPFEDNSIDVISSGDGFGNFSDKRSDKLKVLAEIYRILKPGGLYVSGNGFVTQETLKSFPEDAQKVLLEKRPDIFEDFYDASVTLGFKQIDNTISGGWHTKGDESQIADLAKELGIDDIYFTGNLRYCIK
ncbi:MAG: helix-turn-helix domain-containing protein [Oscillospiraceae bacterium]|nr:helix-turn-helix domain-containing protein [Oscillospiraceae bacterium]